VAEFAQKTNPSMQDVARHAGVSIATVSNVLNRPEKVARLTTLKVRASIEALGFVRNSAARSLAVGSSTSLGIVVADIENSMFVDLTRGAQRASNEAGRRVLIGNADCDINQQDDYLDLFDEARVAGVLLAPMEDSTVGIQRMRAHGRSIVLLNYSPDIGDICSVLVDNEMAGYLAARHLIETGRRSLAFVAGRDYYQPVHDRRAGVKRAVREAGDSVSLEEIDTRGLGRDDGEHVAGQLMMRRRELVPDGIIAVTDAIANGLVAGIEGSSDVRVPRDVGVVGCEDNRSATVGPLPLTTVRGPGIEMGAQAVALLLEEISDVDGSHQHRSVVLQPTLVIRSTTAPAQVSPTRRSA